MNTKINHKVVRQFLSKLSDIDFRYLRLQIQMANDARNLIKEFNLSKEEFCKLLDISEKHYQQYLNGGFEYDIMKMALMNAAYCKLSTERAAKEVEEKFTNVVS